MKNEKPQYKFLIHCSLHQIRKGFEANIKKLPFEVEARYADLLKEGIVTELRYAPHLIVVLQHESDSDYLLPLKIKLFVPDFPMLVISPTIPVGYHYFLRVIGVNHIIQLPVNDDSICSAILNILQMQSHGKP